MTRFIVRRVIQMFILFLVFLTLTFFLLEALPGDITSQLATNPNLPPEARQQAIERLGLDRPLTERFFTYMFDFFRGDFGFAWSQYPTPVTEIIGERLPRTLLLFSTALIVQFYMGFLTGKVLAWRRNKRGEMAITISGVALWTVFYPWFALMMIWLFAATLNIVPINQFLTPLKWRDAPVAADTVFLTMFGVIFAASFAYYIALVFIRRIDNHRTRTTLKWVSLAVTSALFVGYWTLTPTGDEMRFYALDIGHHLILPVVTLALVGFAGTMLLTRTTMLETMKEDYILTARAKGLSEKSVRDGHAARTALLPVVTSLVLAVATVIDGGIITETVFSWPGMGQILVQSVSIGDAPLAIAAFAFTGVLALVGHLVADILYGVLDPRIRVAAAA